MLHPPAQTDRRHQGLRPIAAIALALIAGGAGMADAAETLPGPVPASVIHVIDGDTIKVEATVWLGQRITVNARIRGIDTPELRGGCYREKAMAAAARAELAGLAGNRPLRLTNIENDKYAGRVLADIETADGIDVGAHMLATGLARVYDGGGRGGWCALADRRN